MFGSIILLYIGKFEIKNLENFKEKTIVPFVHNIMYSVQYIYVALIYIYIYS